MNFVFDIDKTLAAVGYLARKKGGQISVFVLMKMMYAAERHALATWHRPITGDNFWSMAKGPILSRTYDLIKTSRDFASVRDQVLDTNSDLQRWAEHFSPPDGNALKLLRDPDFDFLSDREKAALRFGFGGARNRRSHCEAWKDRGCSPQTLA